MHNYQIMDAFMDSIKAVAKAEKADQYAYTCGFLNSFVHMHMMDDPKVVQKMLEWTARNYETAGKSV